MPDAELSLMIVAVAALVRDDGRVLLQQRPRNTPMAGLWEFPGGKLEAGERADTALVRELEEELGIAVAPDDCSPLAFATGTAGARPLLLLLFIVRRWAGEPAAHHAAALQWEFPQSMHALPMPPADVSLVAALNRALP